MCFNNKYSKELTITINIHVFDFIDHLCHLKYCICLDEIYIDRYLLQQCSITSLFILNYSNCMNMYSSELLNFSKSYIDKICVARRKLMRRIYKLNYRTHSYIISCTVEMLLHRETA